MTQALQAAVGAVLLHLLLLQQGRRLPMVLRWRLATRAGGVLRQRRQLQLPLAQLQRGRRARAERWRGAARVLTRGAAAAWQEADRQRLAACGRAPCQIRSLTAGQQPEIIRSCAHASLEHTITGRTLRVDLDCHCWRRSPSRTAV